MRKNRKIHAHTTRPKTRVIRKDVLVRPQHQEPKEIFQVRLAELRKRRKLTQSQVKGFSQVDVSRLERRKDMKVTTLVKYVCGLGAGIKIIAGLKEGDEGPTHEITLFKAVAE